MGVGVRLEERVLKRVLSGCVGIYFRMCQYDALGYVTEYVVGYDLGCVKDVKRSVGENVLGYVTEYVIGYAQPSK